MKLLMGIVGFIAFVVAVLWIAAPALAQDLPPSTIRALPDTTKNTLDLTLVVDVSDAVPAGDLIGIYWTTPAMDGWGYAGHTRAGEPFNWTAPADNLLYQFDSVSSLEGISNSLFSGGGFFKS